MLTISEKENEIIKKQLASSAISNGGDNVQTVPAPDWSNIDFTRSITKAVTKSIKVEKSKERSMAEKTTISCFLE